MIHQHLFSHLFLLVTGSVGLLLNNGSVPIVGAPCRCAADEASFKMPDRPLSCEEAGGFTMRIPDETSFKSSQDHERKLTPRDKFVAAELPKVRGLSVSTAGTIGGGYGACLQRSFDGLYNFFTFHPLVDRHVSSGMLRDGGLYDHMLHTSLVFAIEKAHNNCTADNSVVVDVGCNLGTLTLFALSRGCSTVSFDLQNRIVGMLEASIYANRFSSGVVRNVAVSNVSGTSVVFTDHPHNPGGVSSSTLLINS
jgi:hypothetical protein